MDQTEFYKIEINRLKCELNKLIKSSDSLEMMKVIQEQSIMGVALIQEGIVKYVNDTFASMIGYPKEDVIGWGIKEITEITHPDEREFGFEQLRKKLTNEPGYIANYVVKLINKDKGTVFLEIYSKPIQFKGKTADFITAINITERRKSDELIKKIQSMAKIGNWEWDILTDKVYLSNEALKMRGYDESESNVHPREFLSTNIHPEDNLKIKKLIEKALRTGIPFETEYRTLNNDNTESWIRASGDFVQNESGNLMKVVGYMQDVTERKNLEEEHIKSQKVESMALLAGGIAHDFNNILVGILGNVNLLQTRAEETADDECKKTLKDIEKASFRASNLTQQLLTFSKGGSPIKKIQSIRPIIEESISIALSGSNSIFEIDFRQFIPPVEIDAGQMSQVFNNLLINADQSMPKGGKIFIKGEVVELTEYLNQEHTNNRYVKISVKDEGIGIPSEMQDKIFTPYFSTKGQSGLGLATSHSIIKQHGGFITFNVEKDKGTVFEVYLPVSKNKIVKNLKEKEVAFQGKGNILLLDDDAVVQKTMNKILNKLGFSCIIVDDGNKLLEEYNFSKEKNENITLMIMDLTIPGGHGGKVTIEKLRKIDPNIPVIISSGYSNDPIMADFKKYGFNGVLKKPFTINQLKTVINEVLTSK